LHGANRLGGNSLSDLLVFGKLAGDHAAEFAKKNSLGKTNQVQADQAVATALAPFERGNSGESPYAIQHELQEKMQDLVGIVRREEEMQKALQIVKDLKERAKKVGVTGNREYNPGWHTALDLDNLLTISEAITRSGIERKESRGAQFRDDFPTKSKEGETFNLVVRKSADGSMQLERRPLVPMPAELKQIIEEQK
jgi:succinate dehydrogenase / fumarate reductase flavoprotein subunit